MKRVITILSFLLLYQFSFGQADKVRERIPNIIPTKVDAVSSNVTDEVIKTLLSDFKDNLTLLETNTDSLELIKTTIQNCGSIMESVTGKWGTDEFKLNQQATWLMPELTTLLFDNLDIELYEEAVKFQASRKNKTVDTVELAKLDSIYEKYVGTDSLMKSDFPNEFVNNTDLTNLKFITLLSKKSVGGKTISTLPIIIAILLVISIVITILIFKKMKDEKELKDEFKKQVGFLHQAINKYKELLDYALKDDFSQKSEKSKRLIISRDINAYDDETQNSIKTLEGLIDSFVQLQQKSSIENTQSTNYKEFADNLKEELEEKKKEIKAKDITISALNTDLNKLNALLEEAATELKQPKQVVSGATNESKYIFGEVMLTAGPRKKFSNEENADIDLGEDVSGFANYGDKTLFWLLDGTSDSPVLKNPETKKEFFSSRLLAQSLAYHFQSSYHKFDSFDELVQNAIQETRINWIEEIRKLPEKYQQKIINSARQKTNPICSATLIIGSLTVEGNFVGYRIGDSKMFMFTNANQKTELIKSPLSEKPEYEDNRIFFKIDIDNKGSLTIKRNQIKFSQEIHTNVSTVIAMSDGVGSVAESQLKNNYPRVAELIRKQLSTYPNNTFDDKSLCILQIRENNVTQNES